MNNGKYIIIRPGVGVEVKDDGEGDKPTLGFLQKCVGGWIEHVFTNRLPSDIDIFCNEEGKLKGLPFNLIGTLLYANPHDCIVGTAVIVASNADGDSLWLSDDQVNLVIRTIGEVLS